MFDENELFERLVQLRQYTLVNADSHVVASGNTKIKFFLCGSNKLDMAYFYKAYDQVEADVTHLIFIYSHATIQIKKLKMYKDVLRIEFFSVHELSRLLTGNRLIPLHVQVDPATTAEIFAKFGRDNLPHILQTDPIARLYDFPLDAVVEVRRPDVVYYRLVVSDE